MPWPASLSVERGLHANTSNNRCPAMTSLGHPVTVTGLITDQYGRVLIVRPVGSAHPWWFLPGGLVPSWQETRQEPAEALRGALWHQLRLDREVGPLHLVAYKRARYEGDAAELVLLFDVGTSMDGDALQAAGLWPGPSVAMWRWATPTEAAHDLEPDEAERVAWALRHPHAGDYLIQPHHHRERGGADDADDAAGRPFASVGSP